jgi:hypothetical protein
MGEGLEVEGTSAAKARLHLHAQWGQRHQQYRPVRHQETRDNNWIKTGSHVMIVGAEAKSMMQGYPRDAKPDPTKPYVMWPGTPYEHLMLPVK